jgi:hypothetical protein
MCKKFFLSNPIRSFLNLSKEKVTGSIGGFESKYRGQICSQWLKAGYFIHKKLPKPICSRYMSLSPIFDVLSLCISYPNRFLCYADMLWYDFS